MKLYRLFRGCEGEYGCDNYMGLFKSTKSMLSYLENYIKEESEWLLKIPEDQVFVKLGKNNNFLTNAFDDLYNDYEYEIIDTDDLI